MRLFRPGFIAGWLYPEAIFRIKTAEKVLYLTFDDGPDPASTPCLLDILKNQDTRALFFCSGEAAEKHPDIMNQIRLAGHIIGNHGYRHLDGWRTKSDQYINDVIKGSYSTSDRIFRPPFGHLKIRQYQLLKKKIRIIFWDLMPYEFDITLGSKRSLEILKTKLRPGSIIVLHDKASSCTNAILKDFITYAINSGYRFELIDVVV
jgi:peptidoglycan/xylan/chitin deacetylase (PgdA/CDA1 family)